MRQAIPTCLVLLAAACGGGAPAPLPPPPPPPNIAAAPQPAPATDAAPPPAAPTAAPAPPRPRAEPLQVPADIEKIIAAADRDAHDRDLDSGRHPGELLAFLGIAPGMRVAELGAGTGYTTELLARDVGAKGKVWAQNNAGFLKFVDKPWKERLTKPAMKNVVRVDREFESPLPPDAKNLDAVISVLIYHDTVWLGVDRDKMNKAVFAALKPGGEYVIVDHSAEEGHGTLDTQNLHRIEDVAVTQEVERTGFHRAGDAAFLRNPDDARDWNDAPNAAAERRGKSDRFVIKFVRP
jgi:predicted methyltransferase